MKSFSHDSLKLAIRILRTLTGIFSAKIAATFVMDGDWRPGMSETIYILQYEAGMR